MTAPTSLSAGPAGPTRLPVPAPCVTAQHPGPWHRGMTCPGMSASVSTDRRGQRDSSLTAVSATAPAQSRGLVSGAPQSGHLLSPRRTPHPPSPPWPCRFCPKGAAAGGHTGGPRPTARCTRMCVFSVAAPPQGVPRLRVLLRVSPASRGPWQPPPTGVRPSNLLSAQQPGPSGVRVTSRPSPARDPTRPPHLQLL